MVVSYTGARRKRVSIGEHDIVMFNVSIVECYNLCNGKDWKDVLLFAKQWVVEAGLPEHVVKMFLPWAINRPLGGQE